MSPARQPDAADVANSVAGASYTFSCNSSRGAVAVLGSTGHQQWYLPNQSFRKYIWEHHTSWYDFAVAKDHDISPESLVLISGWVKTSEWAIATFSNQGRAHDISLNASAGSYASATFQVSGGTEVQMSIEQRCGPVKNRGVSASGGAIEKPLPYNQCLFLRYYKLQTRTLGRKKVSVRADAKDMQSPDQEVSRPAHHHQRGSSSGWSSTGSSSQSFGSWLSRCFGGVKRRAGIPDQWKHRSSTAASSMKSGIYEMPQVQTSHMVSSTVKIDDLSRADSYKARRSDRLYAGLHLEGKALGVHSHSSLADMYGPTSTQKQKLLLSAMRMRTNSSR